MREALASAVVVIILMGLVFIIRKIYDWINEKLHGADLNKVEEKFDYLISEYEGIINTKDEQTGREISNVTVKPALNPNKNWKVYKTIEGNLLNSEQEVLIRELSDKKLESLLMNNE